MLAYALGALGAALGLLATWLTIRSTRSLTAAQAGVQAQTAGQISEARLIALHDEVDDERAKRRALEAELDAERRQRQQECAALRGRISRLEQALGEAGLPIPNGGKP